MTARWSVLAHRLHQPQKIMLLTVSARIIYCRVAQFTGIPPAVLQTRRYISSNTFCNALVEIKYLLWVHYRQSSPCLDQQIESCEQNGSEVLANIP